MKSGQALGIIEVTGLSRLVVAVDAALKAAKVTVLTSHKVGKGLVTATINGDVGSVRAALMAAEGQIAADGAAIRVHLIPRPDSAVDAMLTDGLVADEPPTPDDPGSAPSSKPEAAALAPKAPKSKTSSAETAPAKSLDSEAQTDKALVKTLPKALVKKEAGVKDLVSKTADKKSGTKKNSGKPRKSSGKK